MTAIPAPQDCLPAQGDQKKHHELWNILHLNRTRSPGVKLSKSLRHCCYSPAWLELEGNLLETSGNQLYSKNLHMFLQKKKTSWKLPLNANSPENLLGTSTFVAPKSLGPRVPGSQGLAKELPEDLGKGRLFAIEAHQEEVQPLQPWVIDMGMLWNVHQRSSHIAKIYETLALKVKVCEVCESGRFEARFALRSPRILEVEPHHDQTT